MKHKTGSGYDPEVELAKGAKLEAAAYDKTQRAAVIAGKVTVGGKPGIAEITGIATGHIPGWSLRSERQFCARDRGDC